ncbi:hypothetical protein KXD40_008663 [Peronospora effusa]|uniref:FYVE-type domain-containing protein n=1 Tax=Peronospora effusa TaxID=542832 RepID=A0A3M6VH09_9STRA|nr:hypothetical protein DD238_005334 [Peronospora effusa]RQM10179.1 hypothetical protein DD237_004364 [Peronospora effusa]UIZ21843.1 hypothetical protein KXD40_008663 [Peronospora effusa]CAI5705105.1 unnamed protein product [Peronospora effusa]
MNSNRSSQSARILGRVREDAADLALMVTTATHDWKLLSDKNGTQLYEMKGESLTSKVSTVRTFGNGGGGHPSEFYIVRAATTVQADVNTMLDVLRTHTSKDFRAVMKKIFGKQFESGAIVDSLSCTTPTSYAPSSDNTGNNGARQSSTEDDEYNANWITLRAFTKLGGLDGQRDFTMVCYQDVFERSYTSDSLTRKGRQIARNPHRQQLMTGSRLIGVHTFSSMNFKDIPELPRSSKTDRLHFRNSGIVVEELVEEDASGPLVRVSLLLSLMPSKLVLKELSQSPRMRVALAAGHKVAKKYRKWLQTLALGVSHLAEAAKPAVTIQHLSTMTWSNSDTCFLCLKTFRTFRRRYHCRFCGEAVCGSCSSFVDLSSFEVRYESSGSSSNIKVGHCKLNLQATIDGSRWSENASPKTLRDSNEEFFDIRGCNTCASELQMNMVIRSQTRNLHRPILYRNSTSNRFSQLANVCLERRGVENKFDQNSGYCSVNGSPPPYSGHDNDFEHDRVAPMNADDYQQCSSRKLSFSTISCSSFPGFLNDERAQLALDSSNSSAETIGDAPFDASLNRRSSCFVMSDTSHNELLTRDSDILSLNGLMLCARESATQPVVIDDAKDMDLAYKLYHQPARALIRESYATTAATNEGSTHSRFYYSGMTPQEIQLAEQVLCVTKARDTMPMNDRIPQSPHPQDRPSYEQRPTKQSIKKVYHMPPARQSHLSASQSQKSSYSSGSTHSDLIQLNAPLKAPVTTSTDFVVFSGSRQGEIPNREVGDMILLDF